MENASKALIIAGAILLSILLISLGIMIFNQAQSAIDGSGMSDAQLTAFNQKWLKYDGKQKGSTIRTMIQEVMANNNSEEASNETRVAVNDAYLLPDNRVLTPAQGKNGYKIVQLGSAANESVTFGDTFKNTKTYIVSFQYYDGRIVLIDVYE